MGKFKPTKRIAIRTENENFETLKDLALITGGKPVFEECGLAAFTMSDGSLLELYTTFSSYPIYLFENGNVVISFKVDDLEEAIIAAKIKGLNILTEIVSVCTDFRYAHLALPDGTVFGLFQED